MSKIKTGEEITLTYNWKQLAMKDWKTRQDNLWYKKLMSLKKIRKFSNIKLSSFSTKLLSTLDCEKQSIELNKQWPSKILDFWQFMK